MVEQPLVLVVRNNLSIRNLQDFINYTKANHARMQYGSAGVGSGSHLACAQLNAAIGVEVTHVPYRGAALVMPDLISGQVAMGVVGVTEQSLGFHRSGKLKILAVTSPARLIAAPDLPTVADAGFPGLSNQSIIGPVAPARTPKAIVERFNKAADDCGNAFQG
jgi:tripartite-type tricarboxylate transporter receptor subunit TctC